MSFKQTIRFLIPYAIVTMVFGLIYAVVQQDIRQTGNDPQIAIAEEAVPLLAKGIKPADLVALYAQNGTVLNNTDIATSLMPFIAVYDDQGTPLVSSRTLNGGLPQVPKGIFQSVAKGDTIGMGGANEDRVTWQPESGVRDALVVVRYSGAASGYVVVGRSLREIEKRETAAEQMTAVGWLISSVGLIIASILR